MNDQILRQNVIDELNWRPIVNAAHIGVTADNGVVTLTGHVATYAEKFEAERAVKLVAGVRAVVEELQVQPTGAALSSDEEIAKRALNSINWDAYVPTGKVQVKVENGWVALSGEVDWAYQKEAAESAVRTLLGVIGVTNTISLKNQPRPADLKSKIERALIRRAELDAKNIRVLVDDGVVTLEGTVGSWSARERAEDTAWMAPGVTTVSDHLVVR